MKYRYIWKKLSEIDKEVFEIYKKEIDHQNEMLSLNANDNIISKAVLEASSNVFVNSYPEDNKREKSLNRISFHDKIEKLANRRALSLFRLDTNIWGVNLRLVSGTSANFASFMALAGVRGRILGLEVAYGGHHSFNFLAEEQQKTFTERIFTIKTFKINPRGSINYEEIERCAFQFKPDIIIAGGYAVSVDFNYRKMKRIAIKTNSILLGDIAHPVGLISHRLLRNPFHYCDIVTGVFHKTLGGPRSGFIFFKKEYRAKILDACTVLCGNAHTHILLQQAVALKEASSSRHRKVSKKIIRNAKILRDQLKKYGFRVFRTQCHIVLFDLKDPVKAFIFERIADSLRISLNRLSLPSRPNLLHPTGIRLGTTGFTKRGISSKKLPKIAKILCRIRVMSKRIMIEQNLEMKTLQNMNNKYKDIWEYKKMRLKIRKMIKKHPVPHLKID